MAYRKIADTFTINTTNTPQPLIGSWVSAATGFGQACSSPIVLTLGSLFTSGVNDAAMFSPGEPGWLIDPNGANAETVLISKVNIASNQVTLGTQTCSSYQGVNPVTRNPHVAGVFGTGTFIMPKQLTNNFLVQFEDGGTGAYLYIGCNYNMSAVAYRIFKLAKVAANVQPQYYASGLYSPGNPIDISELWVYGTAGDKYALSVAVD